LSSPDGSGILFTASLAGKRYSEQRDKWSFENNTSAAKFLNSISK